MTGLEVAFEIGKGLALLASFGGGFLAARRAKTPPGAPEQSAATRTGSFQAISVKPRALVIEDDPYYASVLRKVLAGMDLEVDVAHTAEQAIALAAQRGYALIVADVGLPDGNGAEVLERIRPRLVLQSGRITDDEMARFGLRVDRVLEKSGDLGAVEAVVRELLADRAR